MCLQQQRRILLCLTHNRYSLLHIYGHVIRVTQNFTKLKKDVRRLKVINALVEGDIEPDWFILKVIPVLPPDLRPILRLPNGVFAVSDLNLLNLKRKDLLEFAYCHQTIKIVSDETNSFTSFGYSLIMKFLLVQRLQVLND